MSVFEESVVHCNVTDVVSKFDNDKTGEADGLVIAMIVTTDELVLSPTEFTADTITLIEFPAERLSLDIMSAI